MSDDYGRLAPLVADAGCLISAAGAIALGWKRRAHWEPCEEDISKGPQRVGSLVAAVGIALLWANQHAIGKAALGWTAGIGALLTVVALIGYTILMTVYVYEMEVATGKRSTEKRKIIGGISLTRHAKQVVSETSQTIQKFFEGAAFDVDAVWPRISRGLAKAVFILAYLCLSTGGTIALASAAMVFGFEAGLAGVPD